MSLQPFEKNLEYIDYDQEKEHQCKNVNYDCDNCDYYCHCRNSNDEFHCLFDCDLINCPLI